MKKTLLAIAITLAATSVSAQEHAEHEPEIKYSMSYGKWNPTRPGECSKEIHDSYSAVSPRDGLTYPTWHPTRDTATGCPFGHNHGFNPAFSLIFDKVGPPLFGEVAQIGSEQDVLGHRHEDHFGYKVFVSNDLEYRSATGPTMVCAVMNTFHTGSHSPDAITNNLHEQQEGIECTYLETGKFALFNHVKLLTPAGAAGQIMMPCAPNSLISTGQAVPSDSPTTAPQNIGSSIGRRKIPTDNCLLVNTPSDSQAYTEIWETGSTIKSPFEMLTPERLAEPAVIADPTANPPILAKRAVTYRAPMSYNPKRYATAYQFHRYPNAKRPSRYFDTKTRLVGRVLDTCFLTNATGGYIVNGGRCVRMRGISKVDGRQIQWDDPRSEFTGKDVGLRMTTLQQNYPNGPEDFCTNVRGLSGAFLNADGTCPKGMVKQHVSNTDLRDAATGLKVAVYTSTAELITYTESDPTVHAPN